MDVTEFVQIILNFLSDENFIVKTLLSFFLAVYILYSAVFFIQTRILTKTLTEVGMAPVLQFLTFAHLVGGVLLLIFVVLII